jgi:spoU rRNA methylase family protein
LYNMKTLRSMQGSHFHLPLIRMKKEALCQLIEESQLPLYATTLSKDSVDYRNLVPSTSFVLVMGNEGQGISSEMVKKADKLVHITMPGQAESLNVAVAAGILMFALI